MYNLEQRERFWDSKVEDLKNKMNPRSRLGKSHNPTKIIPSQKEVNYEELRLMNSLAKEEIEELKTLFTTEKIRNLTLHKKTEELRFKVEELQSLNENLTNLLVNKESQSGGYSKRNSEANQEMQEQIRMYQEKVKILEGDKKKNKELFESRIKGLESELHGKNELVFELQEQVRRLQGMKGDHSKCEGKILECLKIIESLEAQVTQPKVGKMKLDERVQVLEEENQMLKEQIEIYQEDQQNKIKEKEKLHQLSFLILSKDKNTEQETINFVRKTLGDTQAKIIETFFEKNKVLEQEIKALERKLIQEYTFKVENLEKIKVLQETLAKIVPDCGYDSDLSKIKAQIIAAKTQTSGNPAEKMPSGMELYEKTVEVDILKGEIKALKEEGIKLKEECEKHAGMSEVLQMKIRVLETAVTDGDILCFIQCEAAALEDMLADNGSQDLNSEEFY